MFKNKATYQCEDRKIYKDEKRSLKLMEGLVIKKQQKKQNNS